MRNLRDLENQQLKWPVRHGGTTINDGALLAPGTTQGTNKGCLIISPASGADSIGRLIGQLASTVTDTNMNGTVWNQRPVEVVCPMRVGRWEYDTSTTAAVASTSTTTVTITSLENNIASAYLYAVSGTGAGLLAFLTATGSGSCTTKTATAWDSTTTVIKILPLFHKLGFLNTTVDKLGTQAAAGTFTIVVTNNIIKYNGIETPLDPTKHDNLSGLTAYTDLKFFADVAIRNAGPLNND